MKNEEVVQKIQSFPRWHYLFHLKGGITTPIFDEQYINRHNQRKKHFFDVLDFRGKRVLDLGCNAGWWSLGAVEKGGEFVLGIDGRPMHIDQANLVFEVNGIEKDKYEFVQGDVLEVDYREYGTFDVVLCLGLMHHISRPMDLLEKISEVNSDLLVIDTNLSRAPGSYLEVRYDSLDDFRGAIDRELILCHTKQSLAGMVRAFGYSIVMLRPDFDDWTRCMDYKRRVRGAFVCAKNTPLSSFEVEPIDRIRWKDTFFWVAGKIKKHIG